MTNLSAVVPLDGNHQLDQFRCGKDELDYWLRDHALTNHRIGGTRTFVTCEGTVVRGYYSLAASSVEFAKAPRRIRKHLGKYPVSVILLARLAVDQRVQGRRVGESLLIDALARSLNVSHHVGVRAVLVHAMDEDARAFYERYDFERSPTDPLHLFLLVQDIESLIGGPV